jgi:hypothetical protein
MRDLIQKLANAGVPPELLAEVIVAVAKGEAARVKAADRQRRYRERNAQRRCDTLGDVTPPSPLPFPPLVPPLPPAPPSPPYNPPKPNPTPSRTPVSDANRDIEFEVFWKSYPRHINKADAQRAFLKARKTGIEAEVITAGACRYAASARARGTQPEFIAHASTWLNQCRWTDPIETPVRAVNGINPRLPQPLV